MKRSERFRVWLRLLAGAVARKIRKEEPKPLWNLKPEVEAAFKAALAKVGLPAYKMNLRAARPSSSRGRNWYPRQQHAVTMVHNETGLKRLMPAKGYRMGNDGVIRKLLPMAGASA